MTAGARSIPRLHVVTDDAVLASDGWSSRAAEVLAAGGARLALHVRGPGTAGRRIYDLAEALLEPARTHGASLVVNDRVDVALALPSTAVQLREDSVAVEDGRRLLGPERPVGASAHGPERAREAERGGADWLVVGTLFATRSHPQRQGGGAALLALVGEATRLPLVAIGGVTPERVREARRAGAYGVAVLGGVWGSTDAAGAVEAYLSALDD